MSLGVQVALVALGSVTVLVRETLCRGQAVVSPDPLRLLQTSTFPLVVPWSQGPFQVLALILEASSLGRLPFFLDRSCPQGTVLLNVLLLDTWGRGIQKPAIAAPPSQAPAGQSDAVCPALCGL